MQRAATTATDVAVERAQRAGWTWQQIGEAARMTAPGANSRWRERIRDAVLTRWSRTLDEIASTIAESTTLTGEQRAQLTIAFVPADQAASTVDDPTTDDVAPGITAPRTGTLIMPTSLDPEHVDLVKVVGARRAALLAAAATSVAADIRYDADLLTTSAVRPRRRTRVLHLLPVVTWEQSMFWRYQLTEAADRIAVDTSWWGAPVPRCTGEEMALHLALRRAEQADTGSRRRWDDLAEYLFQDEDVLMLYDLGSVAAGMGVHLRPSEWFTDFGTPFPVPNRPSIGGGEPDGE